MIGADVVVFPWLIPANRTKVVIRLAACDTTALDFVTPDFIQALQGFIDYNESDVSDSAAESFLIGLADLFLTNMGHTDYSFVESHVKRLTESYEIQILDLEVVDLIFQC